ncbi:DUF637 domain-containing protein [Zooshikella harenae]|uniref:DUF637 domain-containing protein n=1 Tax=Zooshikella harenae TaxID=2827238 RepID=A0ABS5ZGA6_9GAMM|nr:DUF637 domain-containing protein [Zooshikella harenae]MBU2713081.1 DUF637 domain-containing protein [Zooshikella harenae]
MLNFYVRKLRAIAFIALLSFVNTIALSAYAQIASVPQNQIVSSLESLTTITNSDSEYLFKEVEYLTGDIFNGYEYFYKKLKKDNYNSLLDTNFIPIGVGDITIFIPAMRDMPKFIGTPFVERTLVQSQLTTLIHQRWIPGYESYEDQIKQLYTNGVRLSLSWKLKIGEPVPKEKLSSIPYDLIWPEVININGQQALVPVVYLSKTTLNTKIEKNTVSLGSASLSFENITIDGAHIQVRRNALIKARENFVNKNAVFEAKDIIIAAGRNIENHSGAISGDQLKLIANKVVNNTLVMRHNYAMGFNEQIGSIATIKAIGDINIDTKSDIANIGGEFSAQGSIKLNAGGLIYIVPQQKKSHHEFNSEVWKLKETYLKNIPSKLTAGEALSLISEKTVLIKGSELEGKTLVEILAKLGIRILNDEDSYSYYEKYEVELEGFFSKEREFTEKQQLATTLVRSLIKSGNNIVINTKLGGIVLRAIKLESEGSTEIVAEDGAIDVQIAKEKSFYSYSSESEGTFRFKYQGYGHNKETAFYNELFARGILRLDAAKGFRIEYAGEGSLDEIINNLSQSPELAWLKDVRSRSDINWQHVELALEEWDYKQQGLTKASAAIICIAVAVATGGAGASLLSGVTTNSTLVAMTQAAITNIATQATVSIASGNSIGETLHNLGSNQAIKSLATSVVTAGVLDVVDSNLFNSTPTAEVGSQAATASSSVLIDIPQQSLQMLAHATIRVGIDRLINGGNGKDLDDRFINALALESVNKLGESLAKTIGSADINDAARYILHAALGCVLGATSTAIDGEDTDENELACISGAGGAVVGEFVAEQYREEFISDLREWKEASQEYTLDQEREWVKKWRARGADLSRLSAGLVAFATGGNVSISAKTAENAALNNALNYSKLKPEQQKALLFAAIAFDNINSKKELSEEEKKEARELREWAATIPDDHPHKPYANVILRFMSDIDITFHLAYLKEIDWRFAQEVFKQIKVGDETKTGPHGKPVLVTLEEKLNALEAKRNNEVTENIQTLIRYNSGEVERVTGISELVISLALPGGPLTLRSFKSFFKGGTKVKLGPWMDDPYHPNWRKLTSSQQRALGGRSVGPARVTSGSHTINEITSDKLLASQLDCQKWNSELILSLKEANPSLSNRAIADLAKPSFKVPEIPHGFTEKRFLDAQNFIKDQLNKIGIKDASGFATGSRVTGVTTNPKKTSSFGHLVTDFTKRDLDITLVIPNKMSKQQLFDLSDSFSKKFNIKLGMRTVTDHRELEYLPVFGKIELRF